MVMERLISMTDFVLEQAKLKNDTYELYHLLIDYANFLKQPLTLGMFMPCDLYGNVLEEPQSIKHKFNVKSGLGGFFYQKSFLSYIQKYQEAKARVLFEGIEYVEAKHEGSYNIVRICKSLSTINYPEFWKNKTIEDLIPYNLELTTTALKQIGL